jgi:hypothetical protein
VAGPDGAFTTGELEGSGSVLPPPPLPPAPVGAADLSLQLGELTGLMRELVGAVKEQNGLAKEQLLLARKAEQRFEEQRQAQRDDFQRWLQEHGLVKSRTKPAEETARAVLGQAIAELVDYVEEHNENLADGTDFVRAEMSDKFGGLLHHLWVIYGTLKHLSAAEQPNTGPKAPGA